jgi:hypothetical protein
MPVIFAADQRSKEFRVETTSLPIVIVRGGRVILSLEFFPEACLQQALPNRRFLLFQSRRHGNISIKSCQRRIIQLSRPWRAGTSDAPNLRSEPPPRAMVLER